MSAKTAVIIGAGPAGLTAAYELLTRTDIVPVVLEMCDCVGGIARTVNYKGNRIDVGGHRFFSKSDRVMQWWLDKLPLQIQHSDSAMLKYQGKSRAMPSQEVPGADPEKTDRVMLVRSRKSRIYFLRKFFDYPLRLNLKTLAGLGLFRTIKIGISYVWASLFGPKHPTNLEQFFISRFGRELYLTFFKSYTEKVWGESCSNISAEWGAQRIKGLSIAKAMVHFFRGLLKRDPQDIEQKAVETSLIEQFLYPKHGPGQMWEVVATDVVRRGGQVLHGRRVTKLHVDGDRITSVEAVDESGKTEVYPSDLVFSTMPVKELIHALDAKVPAEVQEVSDGLIYRDFITVGLLMKKLKVHEHGRQNGERISDNWIYIQEPDVNVGRLQIFNNWSPYMVADPSTTWIGLEYFCYESDPLWKMSDAALIDLARKELTRIGIIEEADVLDGTVLRMPKTYPAYFGTYDRFDEIRRFTDSFANLYLIGRNGMHKYNNQDHSMLAAMVAVDNIAGGIAGKANIWDVNTEQEYHEESKSE